MPDGDSGPPGGPPRIQVNQPTGDGDTNFVVHGTGWRPHTTVTVQLAGRPPSTQMPIVDRAGTFNYTINQQHEFFPGPLPAGTYRVLVAAPDGARGETSFTVNR